MLQVLENLENTGVPNVSLSLLLIVLVILLIIVLPNMYWMTDWDEYEDLEWDQKAHAWVPKKPTESPTVCTFYSPGMRESIDRILKKPEEDIIK